MNRYLRIEKFRNIGIDKEERLMINSSLKKGEQGNLIILVGENNSGKSNVLDALMCLRNKKIEKRDVTNLEFETKYHKPILSIVTSEGNKEYSCSLEYGQQSYNVFCNIEEKELQLSRKDALGIFNSLSQYQSYPRQIKEILENEKSSKQDIDGAVEEFLGYIRNNFNNRHSYPSSNIVSWLTNHYPEISKKLSINRFDSVNEQYVKRYGIGLIPNIMVYQEKMISDSDLSCSPDSINTFLSSVLEDIEFKKDDIISAYEMCRSQNNTGFLTKLEIKLNKKVVSISKKFNSIYKLDESCYEFAFRAESSRLSLTISKNGEPITLAFQSTGFHWFFNLYFNLLSRNTMHPGDIIVMDEPATYLHVQGQQELRKFLKDFTIKTGVTIVLATHSPFLVDMDNLDELRIVKNIHGRTTIQNDFSAIDANDSDTLSSVIKALTVKTHILSDPDKQMVFVEGITDYNTLTKAVKLLGEGYQNISFLPVNGIGKDKEQQKEVLRRILEIGRKRNPILLVDGDKAGEAIKKLNGENKDLLVISLSEIDPEFKEIEALFTESDRIKFGIQKENGKYVKSSILSSNIKNYSKEKDFSDETKSNLKKVLDYIIKQSS